MAEADWAARRAIQFYFGFPLPPKIDPNTGLWEMSAGCVISDSRIGEVGAYNSVIHEKVKQFGVPDWAPINRLPKNDYPLIDLEWQLASRLTGEHNRLTFRIFRTQRAMGRSPRFVAYDPKIEFLFVWIGSQVDHEDLALVDCFSGISTSASCLTSDIAL